MCGIIGYSGHRPAVPVIIEGLERLEYRGYDSAGVAFIQNKAVRVVRSEGKLTRLKDKLTQENVFQALYGIGHTRWATHGNPVEKNAHPHLSNDGRLAVVHNGIFENFQSLKDNLTAKGYVFHSDTDTETVVHLISEGLKTVGTLPEAISWALKQVIGSYAIAVVDLENPGVIHAARNACPLILGVGTGENFLASDIPAFLPYTREVVFLDDGELVRIDSGSWQVYKADTLEPVKKDVHHIAWDLQAAEKGGFKHFMLKEIFEQPRVVADCLAGRVDHASMAVRLAELDGLEPPKRLHIVACGTSYHAGMWGKYLLEEWARLPVEVEIASEFRYRNPILEPGSMVLAISQSGETADTLASMRLARDRSIPVIGLCNVVGSTVSRESDRVIYTQAGPEISVASTKAMCSQLTLLFLLALHWGRRRNTLDNATERKAMEAILGLPKVIEAELPRLRKEAQNLSRAYSEARSFLYLGRGLNYPLALEGALKLKEISYIHAEGYAAGEMKHGPIALIDPKFPTFALALNDDLFHKVQSNLVEVQARDGKIIALTHPGLSLSVDNGWVIPEVWGPLNTFMALPALQLFAYEMADYLGKDVDQPRNLAKSVTVE